jgi:hypothetical protein
MEEAETRWMEVIRSEVGTSNHDSVLDDDNDDVYESLG